VFKAAVKVSRPPSKCRGRCRGVQGRCQTVEPLSKCQGCRGAKAAVDVKDTILEINTTVKVKIVRFLSKVLCV
jgi:hypothetical protein